MAITPHTKVLTHNIIDTPFSDWQQAFWGMIQDTMMSDLSHGAKVVLGYVYSKMNTPCHFLQSEIKSTLKINDKEWSDITNELRNHDLMQYVVAGGSSGSVPYFLHKEIEHGFTPLNQLKEDNNAPVLMQHKMFWKEDKLELSEQYETKLNTQQKDEQQDHQQALF